MNAIHDRINQMQNEINNLRNDFSKWIKELQDALNGKADLSQLAELDRSIMERIDNIVKGLVKQLADKNDTKKALKLLER